MQYRQGGKYNMGQIEYTIIADYKDGHKDCLVYTCRQDKQLAEEVLERIIHDPDETDMYHIKQGAYNFRIKEEKADKCWWNDPFLAN